MEFSRTLKEWRKARRLSQMSLASEAGISARHLSFLETGRSRPTAGMVLRIADTLDLPVSGRNEMLAAAGFAPRHAENAARLSDLDPTISDMIEMILQRHDPWPAACFDAGFDLLRANAGFAALATGVSLEPGGDLVSHVFRPGALRSAILNWEEFAPAFLRRLQGEARFLGPRSRLARKLEELAAEPELLPDMTTQLPAARAPPYVAVQLRIGEVTTCWMTTVTMIGSAQDVLLQGLSIEQYFPMDGITRQVADQLVPDRRD